MSVVATDTTQNIHTSYKRVLCHSPSPTLTAHDHTDSIFDRIRDVYAYLQHRRSVQRAHAASDGRARQECDLLRECAFQVQQHLQQVCTTWQALCVGDDAEAAIPGLFDVVARHICTRDPARFPRNVLSDSEDSADAGLDREDFFRGDY
jgi:hypothetical protein